MTESVGIKFGADASQAQEVLAAIAAHLEKIANSGRKAQQGGQGVFDLTFGNIAKLTTQVLGVSSALQVVSKVSEMIMAEYTNFLERNRKAAEAAISYGDAERQFSQSLDPIPGETVQQKTRRIEAWSSKVIGLSGQTGVPAPVLGQTFAGSLGGKGHLPEQAAFAAMEQAAKFRPGPNSNKEDLQGIQDAILMLQKGFPDKKYTAEEAMATISNFMRVDRTQTIDKLTKHILPRAIAARGYGGDLDSFEDIAPLFVAIGQASEDPTGRTTGTNTGNFLKQLRVKTAPYFRQKGIHNPSWMEMKKMLLNTPQGLQARKELAGPLWNDKGGAVDESNPLVRDVLKGIVGNDIELKSEQRQFIPLLNFILQGNNSTTRAYAEAEKQMLSKDDPRLLKQHRDVESATAASKYQRATAIDRTLAGATGAIELGNPVAIASGAVRTRLPELLQARGMAKTGIDLTMGRFDLKSALAESPDEVIDAAITAVERSKEKGESQYLGGPMGAGAVRSSPLTSNQKDVNSKLDEVIAELRREKTIHIESGGESKRATLGADKAGQ